MNKQGQILEADFSTDSSSLTEQRNSEDHYSSIRQRLQNRPRSPSYIEHVTSVVRLSLSASSRSGSSLSRAASSLRWTVSSRSSWMSMSSKSTNRGFVQTPLQSLDEQPRQGLLNSSRKMFYKVAGPFVKGERDIWNEIVDERQHLPVPESRPEYPETGGYLFGMYHINDNYQDIDSLGNTKLHYAAALSAARLALTTIQLLINQGVDVAARNRSGQTFMHVLNTKEFIEGQGIRCYIELLGFLSRLNFPLSQRDFHGRTIAHLLYKARVLSAGGVTDISNSEVHQIIQILDTDMNTLDNHGFNVGDELLQSTETVKSGIYDKLIRINILNAAKGELTRVVDCGRSARLQANFRESLTKPDWTPEMWTQWLQKDRLIDWIDIHGDTPLTALLKNRRSEEQQAALATMIPKLVQLGVEVNMRDRKGHTAIAIAAIRGSLSCVQALLDSGASVDVVNYNGRDIVSMAAWRMKMAKQEGKTQCYASILACTNLIMDIESRESHN